MSARRTNTRKSSLEDQKIEPVVTAEQMMRIGLAALSERVRVLENAVASIGTETTQKKGLFSWLTSKRR